MKQACTFFCFFLVTFSLSAEDVRFAIIGDYGVDTASELAVANLVKNSFQPQFIVTVGDNNYLGPANIDRAIGKYYHELIGNYVGSYGAGAVSNRFFPALGNHDYDNATGFAAHTNYFTLPGNERYYELRREPVHVFLVNSDVHEPDGATMSSVQAQWLSNRLAASTASWRVVVAQDPPYSSASPATRMRWPFREWGASIVFSGHAHHYERILVNGFPYIVNGAGGAGLAGFSTPVSGSMIRFNADHGAVKVIANETNITYEFWSIANSGTLVDRFTQSRPQITIAVTNNGVRLSWPTNGTDGFILESAPTIPTNTWTTVSEAAVSAGGSNTVTVPATGERLRLFRLRR